MAAAGHGSVSWYAGGGERPSRRAAPAAGGGVPMEVDGPPSAAGGPDVAMPAAGPGRLFCPVSGCPCGDAARCAGWTSETTLRRHVDLHLTGHLAGDVPAAWLQARHRTGALLVALAWLHALGCIQPAGLRPVLLHLVGRPERLLFQLVRRCRRLRRSRPGKPRLSGTCLIVLDRLGPSFSPGAWPQWPPTMMSGPGQSC